MIETNLRDGIHNFNFPFVGYHAVGIGNCEIELHLGEGTGINARTGCFISVILTQQKVNAPALEHFIENICTHLKIWIEAHTRQLFAPDEIDWYQVLPYYNNGIWKKVSMQWNAKGKFYHTAEWETLEPLRPADNEG